MSGGRAGGAFIIKHENPVIFITAVARRHRSADCLSSEATSSTICPFRGNRHALGQVWQPALRCCRVASGHFEKYVLITKTRRDGNTENPEIYFILKFSVFPLFRASVIKNSLSEFLKMPISY
jgi:hypothetical protein